MNTFNETLGFVAAICAGVVFIVVFFKLSSRGKGKESSPTLVELEGALKAGERVDVHLSNGHVVAGVRFVGLTNPGWNGANLPYGVAHMLVFERESGSRVLVQASAVRVIEGIEAAASRSGPSTPG